MTENDRIEMYSDLLIRLAAIAEHISGKAIFHSYMPNFSGVRVLFLEHLPPVPQSYLVGRLCADIFLKDNGDIRVYLLEEASTYPTEGRPDVCYYQGENETKQAFLEEIVQDIYQWLVHKKKPNIPQLLH